MAEDEADESASTTVTIVDGGAPTEPDARPPPMPLGAVGRFRLEGRLGSGGMADVYRAYDPALDRSVALKLLHSKDKGQSLRRVLREARAAAALTHPNTVTIFDVGEADGEVFIAMELLAGSTLRARIRRDAETASRADFSLKMKWLTQAATALAAAHERGLVHRDVKPDNMFICTPGDTLKLLDFGIAKRDEADPRDADDVATPDSIGPSSLRTEAGVRVGTPRYMAPEQRAGEPTDARTDQYAWGLVAVELLTGKHPIAAPPTLTKGGPAAGAPAITSENISAALAATPHVSKELATAIAHTLETRREDRFPSMKELIEALDTPDRPAKKPRSRLLPGVIVLAGAAAIGGAAIKFGTGSKTPPAITIAPACHADHIRSLAVGADDRVAPLPNGDIAIARDIRKGLTLLREPAGDAGAPIPFTKDPAALRLLGVFEHDPSYEDISLKGIQLHGGSWVFAAVQQGVESGVFLAGVTDNSYRALRLTPPVSGLDISAFGKDRLLAGVTTLDLGPRFADAPSGAEIYISEPGTAGHPINVERGVASAPTIATSADNTRIAFAYGLVVPDHPEQQKLQLAILNESGDRVSDVKTLRTAPPISAAAAFSGTATATVFWVEDTGMNRLRSSTFTPGDAAPTAPKVAIDEPALSQSPKTARLPDGAWTVAWAATQNNTPMLRIAPVRAGGELGGPANVAPLPAKFDNLNAWASDRGVVLSWEEIDAAGARSAKMAEVTCP